MKKISDSCKCKECIFWARRDFGGSMVVNESDIIGECHRYPPRSDGYTTTYPITKSGSWCGEFKK